MAESVTTEKRQRQCSHCHVTAPGTQTDYTLISRKHRWRVKKTQDASGEAVLRWYCPECWRKLSERGEGAS